MHREGGLRVFDNPGLSPSDWRPELSTLSLDIETGRDGTLYGIALDYADVTNRFRRAAVLDPAAARAPGGTSNPSSGAARGAGIQGMAGTPGGTSSLSSGAARGAGGAVRGQLIQEQSLFGTPPRAGENPTYGDTEKLHIFRKTSVHQKFRRKSSQNSCFGPPRAPSGIPILSNWVFSEFSGA